MKSPILILCVLCVSAVQILAQTLKVGDKVTLSVDKKEYKDAEIASITPTDVELITTQGIDKLDLASLPPEWQTRFAYDPAKAQEYTAQIAAKKQVQTVKQEQVAQKETQAKANEVPENIKKAVYDIWMKQITKDFLFSSSKKTSIILPKYNECRFEWAAPLAAKAVVNIYGPRTRIVKDKDKTETYTGESYERIAVPPELIPKQ